MPTETYIDFLTECTLEELFKIIRSEIKDIPKCANPDARGMIVEMINSILNEIEKRATTI